MNSLFHLFSNSSSEVNLMVFSHLRWDFVYQRPQQIMSRMARKRKILFIEEPIAPSNRKELGTAKLYSPEPNITVLQPKLDSLQQLSLLNSCIEQYIKNHSWGPYMSWFYSPEYVDMLTYLEPVLTVYDCMDELSAFLGAPKSLLENEQKLLKLADIVFTGGKSLYESKSKKATNVFCYPSAVNVDHFNISTEKTDFIPKDLRTIPHPIVGFYGVLDERLNLSLLQAIASLLPNVTFLMIGPVVKIQPNSLPMASNLLYLGQKTYKELPLYLKEMEIAMMPFALNDSTRFISPTKTLEFMAAGKPIVSTPITDVVRDYSQIVEIASTAEEFATKIQKLLDEPPRIKKARLWTEKRIARKMSWDKTVGNMEMDMKRVWDEKYDSWNIPQGVLLPSLPHSIITSSVSQEL